MTRPILIAPSLLSAKLEKLGDEIRDVEAGGADWLHVDVMDGQFVPPITFGANIVEAARRVTPLPLDVHLMIATPDRQLRDFAEKGAAVISVHAEACPHLQRTLAEIRRLGSKAGVVLSPHVPESAIEYVLDDVDLVLVMSVNPGYGGQKFIDAQLPKLERIADRREQRGLGFLLEIDGGINSHTAVQAVSAGAEVLVAGTAVFGAADRGAAITELRAAGERAKR